MIKSSAFVFWACTKIHQLIDVSEGETVITAEQAQRYSGTVFGYGAAHPVSVQ